MTAYYNEFDPFAAAWIKELIADGQIAPGVVDERSIKEVQPSDLQGFTQCHFFAGIGGWSYALRLARWGDNRPVWTGSCPCQPFSAAGQRKGEADERHLWPDFRRLIAGCAPPIVFGEQVASADGRVWLDGVRTDLEALAYEVGAADLCAAGVGAPHIRQRLYWMAHTYGGLAGDRHLQSGGEHGQQPQDGGAGERVDDTPGARHIGAQQDPETETRDEARLRLPSEGRGLGGVGEPAEGRRGPGRPGEAIPGGITCGPVKRPSPDSGVADTLSAGRPEWGTGPGDRSSPWSGSFIECADGKSRRIEPSIFPLAHGVSNRVGQLRGAGNAIVPQVAAEFIRAGAEAMRMTLTDAEIEMFDKALTATSEFLYDLPV